VEPTFSRKHKRPGPGGAEETVDEVEEVVDTRAFAGRELRECSITGAGKAFYPTGVSRLTRS